MPTIKGPIKLGKNLTEKEKEEMSTKFEEAGIKIKLPFKATGFKSTKKLGLPVDIKESTPQKTAEKPEKTVKNKMFDNYLDQNTRTIKRALEEDEFDEETLTVFYDMEKKGKKRKSVLKTIENMLGGE